jgi:ABC-type transport system involved in multi-copper enzyme maturation permease subunit
MKKDGAFLLTRPATTMDLIAARWEANAKAVVMTIIPVMLAAAIVFLTPQTLYTDDPAYENVNYFAYMSEQLSGGLVILMVVAAVISLCIAMWALLWIENIMGLCGIGAVVAIVFASLGHLAGFEPDDLEAPGFVTATILITATTMLLAAVAKRKNLLNTKYLILLLALIPVIGVGVLMSTQGNALVGQYPIDKNSFLIALPLVMSVVVAPIITGPLLMDWVRHKR